MRTLYTAYCINWTETERGWGTRPDGHTLHRDLATAQEYVAAHWARLPNDVVPDEYSRPDKPFVVTVTEQQFRDIEANGTIWGHPTMRLREPESV